MSKMKVTKKLVLISILTFQNSLELIFRMLQNKTKFKYILQIGVDNKVSIVCNKLLLIPIYCEDVLTAGPLSSLASLPDDSNVFMLHGLSQAPITLNSLHHISAEEEIPQSESNCKLYQSRKAALPCAASDWSASPCSGF